MQRYSDCPQVVRDFLVYHETIKGQSQRTISEYYLDLRMFLRFMKLMRCDMPIHTRLEDIPIKDIDLQFIKEITTSNIYDFLSYLANDRTPNPDTAVPEYGISPAARARKLSAIKSFYKYLTVRTKQLNENPVAEMEYPKLRKSLPKYLTLEQSAALLQAVSGQNEVRDYAILMLLSMKTAFVWLVRATRNGQSILALPAGKRLMLIWSNATKRCSLIIVPSSAPGMPTVLV